MVLFTFCKCICFFYGLIVSDIFWKEFAVFSFCPKNYFQIKCFEYLTVLDKILSCTNVVTITKFYSLAIWHMNEYGIAKPIFCFSTTVKFDKSI